MNDFSDFLINIDLHPYTDFHSYQETKDAKEINDKIFQEAVDTIDKLRKTLKAFSNLQTEENDFHPEILSTIEKAINYSKDPGKINHTIHNNRNILNNDFTFLSTKNKYHYLKYYIPEKKQLSCNCKVFYQSFSIHPETVGFKEKKFNITEYSLFLRNTQTRLFENWTQMGLDVTNLKEPKLDDLPTYQFKSHENKSLKGETNIDSVHKVIYQCYTKTILQKEFLKIAFELKDDIRVYEVSKFYNLEKIISLYSQNSKTLINSLPNHISTEDKSYDFHEVKKTLLELEDAIKPGLTALHIGHDDAYDHIYKKGRFLAKTLRGLEQLTK